MQQNLNLLISPKVYTNKVQVVGVLLLLEVFMYKMYKQEFITFPKALKLTPKMLSIYVVLAYPY